MKQEDKELILKDLCARSFYSVMVTVPIISFTEGQGPYTEPIELVSVNTVDMTCTVGDRYAQTSGIKMFNRKGELICKPYLRPMSSMTEEETKEFFSILTGSIRGDMIAKIDFYIKHHFDFRLTSKGLSMIEAGLALKAPEGMYKTVL